MGGPTYRIPATGLYLEADGRLVREPNAGATVVDASEALAPKLTAAYVGKGLQLMSTAGGNEPSGDSTKAALKRLGEGLETIVLIGDIVELAIKLAEFMGLFGHEKDAAIVMLEWIDKRLNEIEDLILAAWASSRGDQLALLRGKSSTALRAAQEYLELNRPQTQFWQSRIALADSNSEEVVKAYTESGLDGGFWLRPFSLRAIGVSPTAIHNSWLHFHPGRDAIAATSHITQVWDYRFALPAVTYAILVRVAVLKAVKPQSLQRGQAGCREIQGYARFLRSVVQRIQDGLWSLNALGADQGSRAQFLWHGRAPVAAAQVHSGYGFMRIIYAYEWEYLRPSDPAMWPAGLVEPFLSIEQVNQNIRNVGTHWWHLIWRDIGMIEMCKILSDLDRVCTQPYASRFIGEAQTKLIRATLDVTSRWSASVATSLSHLTSDGDAAEDSVRTFRLYEALQRRDDAVRGVLRRTAEELLALAPVPEEPHVRPEPAAWWRGEEDASDSAGDNEGLIVGHVRFVPGRSGQAFAFVLGGYIEVPNSTSIEPQTLTVAAWVRRDAAPAECAYLLSKGARACTAAAYALYTGETGGLIFYVSDGERVAYSLDAGRELWNNAWHFVAGSYDGEFVRLYVDGAEIGAGQPATVQRIEYRLPDGDSLFLGAYRGTCDLRFDDGQMDEVRVFNRALTAEEIRDLYNREA